MSRSPRRSHILSYRVASYRPDGRGGCGCPTSSSLNPAPAAEPRFSANPTFSVSDYHFRDCPTICNANGERVELNDADVSPSRVYRRSDLNLLGEWRPERRSFCFRVVVRSLSRRIEFRDIAKVSSWRAERAREKESKRENSNGISPCERQPLPLPPIEHHPRRRRKRRDKTRTVPAGPSFLPRLYRLLVDDSRVHLRAFFHALDTCYPACEQCRIARPIRRENRSLLVPHRQIPRSFVRSVVSARR